MNIEALKEAHDLSLDGRDFAARQIILDVIADLEKKKPAQQEPVAWTLLLVGEHHGIIGKAGDAFASAPEHYRRVDVYTSPPPQRTEQEPFEDLATELFVVAQTSPADDGFSDTIKRIESWLREHFSTPPQRKPLTDMEIEKLREKTFSTGNPYCPVDSKSMRKAARAIEAAHGIKENT